MLHNIMINMNYHLKIDDENIGQMYKNKQTR